MTTEPKQPDAWPLDAAEGARMILAAMTALLHGPAALVYVQPGVVEGQSHRLMAKMLLDDAEILAAGAMNRSRGRGDRSPVGAFFRQGGN